MGPRAYPKHTIPPRLGLGVRATTSHSGKRTEAAYPCCKPLIDRGDEVGVIAARLSRVVSRPAPPREAERRAIIERVCAPDVGTSRARTLWCRLPQAGVPVTRRTMDRFRGKRGLRGIVRGRKPRTAISTRVGPRPWDPVTHHFKGAVANELWVSDPPTGR